MIGPAFAADRVCDFENKCYPEMTVPAVPAPSAPKVTVPATPAPSEPKVTVPVIIVTPEMARENSAIETMQARMKVLLGVAQSMDAQIKTLQKKIDASKLAVERISQIYHMDHSYPDRVTPPPVPQYVPGPIAVSPSIGPFGHVCHLVTIRQSPQLQPNIVELCTMTESEEQGHRLRMHN